MKRVGFFRIDIFHCDVVTTLSEASMTMDCRIFIKHSYIFLLVCYTAF